MKEQLITFETAKLAKEKGFNIFNIDINLKNNIIINDNDIYIDSKNIDGKYYLYINEDNCVYSLEVGQFNSVIGSFNSFAKEYILKETNDYFHAPTQSLLQKWLREKYEIYIEVEITDNTKYFHFKYILITSKDRDYNDLDMIDSAKRHWNDDRFKTYEEALEKGLQEALKLI